MIQYTESTKELLRELEGLRLTAYKDAHGYSVGYGHFGVAEGTKITKEKAEQYLNEDLQKAIDYLKKLAGINQYNQFEIDALASMAYNLGSFGEQLKAAIKSGDRKELKRVMRLYVNSEGRRNEGLVIRREKEISHMEKKLKIGGTPIVLLVIGGAWLAG